MSTIRPIGGRKQCVFDVKLDGHEDFDEFKDKLGEPFNNDPVLTLKLWNRFWAYRQRDPHVRIDKMLPDLSNVVHEGEYFVILIG